MVEVREQHRLLSAQGFRPVVKRASVSINQEYIRLMRLISIAHLMHKNREKIFMELK